MMTPDASLIVQLKNARDVVHMALTNPCFPSDLVFISALVDFQSHAVRVTKDAPVVSPRQDVVDAILAVGGHAILQADARDPAKMHKAGEQFRLITGDTIPLLTVNNDRDNVLVPMLKRDLGTKPLCVPGGFASSPDVRVEELVEETALCLFNRAANRVTILASEAASFIRPSRYLRGARKDEQFHVLTQNVGNVWNAQYRPAPLAFIEYGVLRFDLRTELEDRIRFEVDGATSIIIPGKLVPHWEITPELESERNIVGMHGYAMANIAKEDGDELFMVDPEPYGEMDAYNRPQGRNGVLMRLNDARDWKVGGALQGGLGRFINSGFLPWAETLRDPQRRGLLVSAVRHAKLTP